MTQALLEKKNTGVINEEKDMFIRQLNDYPQLTEEQTLKLAEGCARGDEESIRTMVCSNLGLVVAAAQKFEKKYAGADIPYMEWIQEGAIGLIAAAKNYDPTQSKFSTYATKCINQHMKNCVLDPGAIHVPSGTMKDMRRILAAKSVLLQEKGEEPTPEQIALRCDLSPEKVEKLLPLIPQVSSLDVTVGNVEDALHTILEDAKAFQPYEEMVRRELEETIAELMSHLDERQQHLLRLRFGMEDGVCHSLQQIADILGITKERTRQVEQQAIKKLQKLGANLGLEEYLK
jgi:RNA polymerase primary sigma factor